MSGLKPSLRRSVDSALITQCKLCPCGVYRHQERVWRSTTPIGWVHKGCEPGA